MEPSQNVFPRPLALVALCLPALLILTGKTIAQPLLNPPPGTYNVTRANNSIAQVSDASAAFQNPANLVEATGLEAQLSASRSYFSVEYTPPFRSRGHSAQPWRTEPNAFAALPLADGKFALGLSVTAPYWLSTKWDTKYSTYTPFIGPWRSSVPYSTALKTMDVSPAFAARIGEHLQIGAGLDVLWSELRIDQFIVPAGNLHLVSDDLTVGAHAGVTWSLGEHHRLAVTCRLPFDLNYEGDYDPEGLPAQMGDVHGRYQTQLKLPTRVAAAYGVQIAKSMLLEADVEWLQYSRFDEFGIAVSDVTSPAPLSFRTEWNDTWNAGVGGQWEFIPRCFLRAGYRFIPTPIPDGTFHPMFPDSEHHELAIGLAFRSEHHLLEAGGAVQIYQNRYIDAADNELFPGKYEFTSYLFSVAYQYRF